MAPWDALKHSEAYSGRKSESTRNPHSGLSKPSRKTKVLSKLCTEERVLEQWRRAAGEPVSDNSKVQFQVHCLPTGMTDQTAKTYNFPGNVHRLADVRLWTEHHEKSSKKVKDTGTIYLEFFFDGTPESYEGNQDVFIKAFEQMVENQLQESRVVEFRKRFAARRRGGLSKRDVVPEDAGEGGGEGGTVLVEDDSEWKQYLNRPVPATDLSVRSLREAGCMLSFLVVQTSLSVSAAEIMGQITFNEHFPIDGKDQEMPTCEKPMPKWAHGLMLCTGLLGTITLFAWWQAVKVAMYPHPTG